MTVGDALNGQPHSRIWVSFPCSSTARVAAPAADPGDPFSCTVSVLPDRSWESGASHRSRHGYGCAAGLCSNGVAEEEGRKRLRVLRDGVYLVRSIYSVRTHEFVKLTSCRAMVVIGTIMSASACDPPQTPNEALRSDSSAILRATLAHLVARDSGVLLNPRLIPADSMSVRIAPFSERHDSLPASAWLDSIARTVPGAQLIAMDQELEEISILSVSAPIIIGERAYVHAVYSTFKDPWGYSGWFTRASLALEPTHGWTVLETVTTGTEN